MVREFSASAATLNLVRAFTTGGMPTCGVHDWNKGFVASGANARYGAGQAHRQSVRFMAAPAVPTSRRCAPSSSSRPTGAAAGVRGGADPGSTRAPDARTTPRAHGLGRRAQPATRRRAPGVRLAHPQPHRRQARPQGRPGVCRQGHRQARPAPHPRTADLHHPHGRREVRDAPPPLVEQVTAEGASVVWICDPMHGNTFESTTGYKTRDFDDVVDGRGLLRGPSRPRHPPGGIHVELTGNDVTGVAWRGRRSSPRISRSATRRCATHASTTNRPWSSRSSSPRCSQD